MWLNLLAISSAKKNKKTDLIDGLFKKMYLPPPKKHLAHFSFPSEIAMLE